MVYHRYPPGKEMLSSVLAFLSGHILYWVRTYKGVKGGKRGKGGCGLHPLPASVSCTWPLCGLCSWLCGSGEMGMSSRLTGGSLVQPPPLER